MFGQKEEGEKTQLAGQLFPLPKKRPQRGRNVMIPNECSKNNQLQELKKEKIFNRRTSDLKERYYDICRTLDTREVECNTCHHKHCHKHDYYERNYLIIPNDLECEDNKVRILRVKCTECHHTHAILPEEIVPYQQYSLIFIITALILHYVHDMSIRNVCLTMNINKKTFIRWIKTFKRQLIKYYGIFKSLGFSYKNELIKICDYSEYVREFGEDFLSKTDRVFMQKHKNPTNYHMPKYLLLF